jgi:GTP:adenosylcobinamide-phosphate guanylyltransferase
MKTPPLSQSLVTVNALVLAGRRSGEDDPLSGIDGASHKALLLAGGKPLIRRVIDALRGSGQIGAIRIAAPEDVRAEIEKALRGAGAFAFVDAAGSPASTVLAAIEAEQGDAPLLITTCDHALLSPEIVRSFIGEALGSDAAAACVERTVYEQRFPGSQRTFIKLRDLSFSGANLFWFRGARAKGLASFWRRIEAKRKKPVDMAREIGVITALSYLAGIMTRAGLEGTIRRKTGVAARLIPLAAAEASIDVDKPQDLELVRSILALD